MVITEAWIVANTTHRGGWNAKQLAAIGISWPPVRGWKERAAGKVITAEQQAIFESFAGKISGAITGSLYKPSGDCAGCCEPWEVCDWPCPDAIEAPNTRVLPCNA